MVGRLDKFVHTPSSAITGGTASCGESAARFEEALTQAAASTKRPEWSGLETGSVSLDGILPHSQALVAADDAWVEVVATAEELSNPELSPEAKQMLLKRIAEHWRMFQSHSEPITRMLEHFAVMDGAAGQAAGRLPDRTELGGDL
jgi:hypothetical protein